ncbi:uncharacterized protein LOC131180686 [Hevea brasiliensis]|uniref:uncharacterized protein LOC131180686 n=1 Tax=Hevea brasiliensis TaxID=3981 RepID=UPI0025D13A30|nr:uncharacterized protein LOC131180686 [Hevea brasiliensis]
MESDNVSEVRDAADQYINEALKLQNSDNPGLSLVSVPLNCMNYLTWSRSMVIALCAKDKLGFITGKVEKPPDNFNLFEKWRRVDCMVISWILNSISKELVEYFIYTPSAKDLWNELEQRFGVNNGPLLYNIKREIASFTQGVCH